MNTRPALLLFAALLLLSQINAQQPETTKPANLNSQATTRHKEIKGEELKQAMQEAQTPPGGQSISGKWKLAIKWATGGKLSIDLRIAEDPNLENSSLEQKDRDALKKEFPDHAAYAGKAQWEVKGKPQSETWVVLVKGEEIRIAARMFGCAGTKDGPNAMRGRCNIQIIKEGGSFEATRSNDPS